MGMDDIDRDAAILHVSLVAIVAATVALVSIIGSQRHSHRKRLKRSSQSPSEDSNASKEKKAKTKKSKVVEEKLCKLAESIGDQAEAVKNSMAQDFSGNLWEALKSCEGWKSRTLVDAFKYLLQNEIEAKTFIVCSVELRNEWLKDHFKEDDM